MLDHEKLNVDPVAISFIKWLDPILKAVNLPVREQLDRASTSIPLNIAEENGNIGARDCYRFFEIARGSALESAACLDTLAVKGLISAGPCREGKVQLESIVALLIGLIRRLKSSRWGEEGVEYITGEGGEQEEEQEQEYEQE